MKTLTFLHKIENKQAITDNIIAVMGAFRNAQAVPFIHTAVDEEKNQLVIHLGVGDDKTEDLVRRTLIERGWDDKTIKSGDFGDENSPLPDDLQELLAAMMGSAVGDGDDGNGGKKRNAGRERGVDD